MANRTLRNRVVELQESESQDMERGSEYSWARGQSDDIGGQALVSEIEQLEPQGVADRARGHEREIRGNEIQRTRVNK
jgi:hypothetical protein